MNQELYEYLGAMLIAWVILLILFVVGIYTLRKP